MKLFSQFFVQQTTLSFYKPYGVVLIFGIRASGKFRPILTFPDQSCHIYNIRDTISFKFYFFIFVDIRAKV